MRCSCGKCGTYMTHSESMRLGCVCPNCLNRCDACLGTNTVVSREDIINGKWDISGVYPPREDTSIADDNDEDIRD